MAKHKCKCPKPGLTAPFYMLTYGDMMTLLLTFFVLLFSMSTMQTIKFQAQVGVMQGAMGISPMFQHSPMQKNLPEPSVKESSNLSSRAVSTPESQQIMAEHAEEDDDNTMREKQQELHRAMQSIGEAGHANVSAGDDEIILTLPTYGIFRKGEWQVDPNNPEVQRVLDAYRDLAKQIAVMSSYDIHFVGHTDSLPIIAPPEGKMPRNNMELGFLRAVSLYDFFFREELKDLPRITFASQGDNVPVIPDARMDSERRKNRRVQIHLKKRQA
ncbi:MAG: hypothetical protein KDK78_12320 [Chlamydiia bacterium]|nr:hypothetical protein [Chlamydiia bacterium]